MLTGKGYYYICKIGRIRQLFQMLILKSKTYLSEHREYEMIGKKCKTGEN